MDTNTKATLRQNSTRRSQDNFLENVQAYMEEHFPVIDLGPQADAKTAGGEKCFPFDQRNRWWSEDKGDWTTEPDREPVEHEVEFFDIQVDPMGEKYHNDMMRQGYYTLNLVALARLIVAQPDLLANGDKLCVTIVYSPMGNGGQLVLVYEEDSVRHLKVVTQVEASKMTNLVHVARKLRP